jgi:hypothetical protein
LLLFLVTRLRASGQRLPDPRVFACEEVAAWVSQDEEDMKRFREGT